MLKFIKFNKFIVCFFIFESFVHFSAEANICARTFSKIFNLSLNKFKTEYKIKTFSTIKSSDLDFSSDIQLLAKHITHGLLLKKNQDDLFKLYITSFFSHSSQIDISLKHVFDIIYANKNIDLSKLSVREQIIHFLAQKPRQSNDLINFVTSFRKTSGQIRNNLFQVEANYGFWTKLLDFPPIPIDPTLDKKTQQLRKEKHKALFIDYLNTTPLNKDTREFIKDTSHSYQIRTITLYKALDKLKQLLPAVAYRVSQIMVELIHTSGFGNKDLTDLLKNQNAIENITTVKNILNERDLMAQKLEFNNFTELKNSLNGKIPDMQKALQKISDNIFESPDFYSSVKKEQPLRLRTLTIQESPFRSCLSGDCSSMTYFARSLDPNYLYWTLTDSDHKSYGHVTIILGTTKTNNKLYRTQTAFVDKIQNILPHQIEAVLQGIYLSLKEKGYTLGLPVDLGFQNDLTNDDNMRYYIKDNLLPKLKNKLNKFEPHKNNFSSYDGFSRADNQLDLLEWSSITLENVKISAGEFPTFEEANKKLNAKSFINYILSLKNSTKKEDQIKFFKLISLQDIKYVSDNLKPLLDHIHSVLRNPEIAFSVRKQAFFSLICLNTFYQNKFHEIGYFTENFNVFFLEKYFSFFSDLETKIITGEMSNWVNTSDYRVTFIKELKNFSFDQLSDQSFLIIKDILGPSVLLLKASLVNNIKIIKKVLLEKKVNLNIKSDEIGKTALIYDSQYGHLNTANLLIQAGVNVNDSDNRGRTALMYASHYGHLNIAKLLIQAGVNVNNSDNGNTTALMYASQYGYSKIANLLIKAGANVNDSNIRGTTALMYASQYGYSKIVNLLIKAGANINDSDNRGRTALIHASQYDHSKIVNLLIKAGAN